MHVHFPLGELADYAKKFDQQAIFNSNNTLGSSLGILNLPQTAVDVINQTSSLTSSLSLHTNVFKQQQQQDSNSNTTTTTNYKSTTNASNTVGRDTSSKSEDNEENDDDAYTSSLFPLEDLFLSNSMYHVTSNHSTHEYPKEQQQQSLLLRDNFCPTNRTTSMNTITYAAASTVTGIDNTDTTSINTNKNNSTVNINSKNKVFNNINDNNNVNNDNNDYYTTHILSLGNNPRESLYRKQTIVESLHAFVQQFSIERNMYLQEYVNYLCRKFDIKIDDT